MNNGQDYNIVEIKKNNEMEKILLECGDSIYNKEIYNDLFIKSYSKKIYKYGNFKVIKNSKRDLLGFITFYDNDHINKTAFLSMIIIKKEHQHKGYGKIILEDLIKSCKEKEMGFLQLEVADTNTNAIQFYEKIGFELKQRKTGNTSIYELELKKILSDSDRKKEEL